MSLPAHGAGGPPPGSETPSGAPLAAASRAPASRGYCLATSAAASAAPEGPASLLIAASGPLTTGLAASRALVGPPSALSDAGAVASPPPTAVKSASQATISRLAATRALLRCPTSNVSLVIRCCSRPGRQVQARRRER